MKKLTLCIGIFCAFCTLSLYGEDVYTTSISVVETEGWFVLSWLANVSSGEFVLFGADVPIVSPQRVGAARLLGRTNMSGVRQDNLYRYVWRWAEVGFPYLCILPAKERYDKDDVMPALNANLVAYAFLRRPRETVPAVPVADARQGQVATFQVRGNVFGNRVVLSWFFEGFEGHEFSVYRLTEAPSMFFLQRASPIARVRQTAYEDVPPIGGPYYYVLVQNDVFVISENNVFGPVWFPAAPTTNRTRVEESVERR